MKVYIQDIRNYEGILPNNIFVDQIKDFKNELLNKQNHTAWTMLYNILKEEYNIKDFNVYYKATSKPYLKDIYFNISHSLNLVAIVISNEECGIDIECINQTKNIERIKKHFNINSDDEFYEKWTRKEAYLKKIGTGIKISSLFEEVNDITTEKVEDSTGNIYYISYC